MKKFLLVCFLFTLFCLFAFPVLGINYTAENNPEFNLNVRTYDPLGSGRKQLVDEHDPRDYGLIPPQLCTLVAGNQSPDIPNLYQIHEYDFGNNKPRADYVSVPDLLPDYSSLIGLSVMPGQNILVPNSGYNIGGGKQVIVIYASSNQVFLKYAVQDDIQTGYGIHILGINTDPELLSAYNQANSQGRTSLPALGGGEIVGTAANSEILVSVRDSGSFMDPRWRRDWWFRCEDTQGMPFQGGTIPTQPGRPLDVFPSCTPSQSGNYDSRPYAPPSCNACGVGPTTSSCSTSFNVYDEITYLKKNGALCTDGQYWIPEEPKNLENTTGAWGGTITLNPKQTTVPFVGKKGEENEIKYLADYFEGTNEYYNSSTSNNQVKYANGSLYYLDWINYAGVNRKLLPVTVQDNLKEKMVTRVKNSLNQTTTQNVVHDYKIGYNSRICWDFPYIADVFASVFIKILKIAGIPFVPEKLDEAAKYTHYCKYAYDPLGNAIVNDIYSALWGFNLLPQPFKIKYSFEPYWHAGPIEFNGQDLTGITLPVFETTISALFDPNTRPPKSTDKDYVQKYQTWKEKDGGKWYRLWAVLPMVSREDSKGSIIPRLGAGEGDTLTIIQPDPKKNPTIDYVPHVERLSELGKIVQKTLVPTSNKVLGENVEGNQEYLRNNGSVLANQTTLLAQAAPFIPVSLELTLNLPGQAAPGQYQLEAIGKITTHPSCPAGLAHTWFYITSNKGAVCPTTPFLRWLESGENFAINDLSDCSTPTVFMNWNDTYSINVTIDGWDAIDCGDQDYKFPVSASCYMKLLPATGTTPARWESNCGAAASPAPACGLVQPKGAPACDKLSITDSNPNDPLCCTEVTAKLSARESFANTNWTSCTMIVNGLEVYNPDCDTKVDKQVSRGVAVSLSQPYLKQIWDETANPISGVFNLFRPASIPKFEPLDAASTISYNYSSNDLTHNVPDLLDNKPAKAKADPSSGTFYYPYLGGIQQAKTWVIKTLTPYPSVN
jgi:hypothetical protein